MNSIHERHVSLQEKPWSTNHTFPKITMWRNTRQTKRNSRSCHHIALVTSFPTSQKICNSDFVWESYANFSEDAREFLCHKISHFSPKSCEIPERIDDDHLPIMGLFTNSYPKPLYSSICSERQRPHTWRCQRPYHQLQEFQSLLQSILQHIRNVRGI